MKQRTCEQNTIRETVLYAPECRSLVPRPSCFLVAVREQRSSAALCVAEVDVPRFVHRPRQSGVQSARATSLGTRSGGGLARARLRRDRSV